MIGCTDSSISCFSQGVREELKYYVYRLIDPRNGETFYVGKGKDDRVFAHVNDEEENFKLSISEEEEKEDDTITENISQKFKRIREILSSNETVIHIIHRHGLSSKEALLVEATLIDAFPGLANIQGGVSSSEFGPRSARQIQSYYKKEEAVFDDNVIMIAINKMWGKGDISQDELYDATRYAWKLSKEKSSRAEFALAHANGIIREVYKPEVWLPAIFENFGSIIHMEKDNIKPEDYPSNRLAFKGGLAPQNIREKYKGKRIPAIYRKKGAANPVKYNFK